MTINWIVPEEDAAIIHQIAARAAHDEYPPGYVNAFQLEMDITACHANGTPLKLTELLFADHFNFIHDIDGIRQHINRRTGQLEDQFVPRYSA